MLMPFFHGEVWHQYCRLVVVSLATATIMSCNTGHARHEKPQPTEDNYRHLAWQIIEDVAELKNHMPFMAQLDLANDLSQSLDPMRLQLLYEHGKIQISNARWMPDGQAPKTIQGYKRTGVLMNLTLSLEPYNDQDRASPNRIGQLKISLVTNGPKGHQLRFSIRKMIDQHRFRFTQQYRL